TGTTTFLGTGQQGTIFTNGVTWTRAELFSFATPTTVTISGTAKEGQTLTANAATNDADATIHYQWQKSSDNFLHATNIGTDSSTYVVQEADEGFKIRVVASTSDRDNSSTASATSNATSPVTDITLAFTSAASISGTAQEGQTLTAVNGTLNDADAAVTSYQWQELISGTWTNTVGATSQTYLVTEANEGQQIRVKETADGDGGPSVTSTSAATNPVTDITLAFTSTASIDNTSPKEGDTLTAVNGTLNDSDAAGTGYQWQEGVRRNWTQHQHGIATD